MLFPHFSPINVKFCMGERTEGGASVRSPVPNFTFIGATCRPYGAKTLLLDYWVKTMPAHLLVKNVLPFSVLSASSTLKLYNLNASIEWTVKLLSVECVRSAWSSRSYRSYRFTGSCRVYRSYGSYRSYRSYRTTRITRSTNWTTRTSWRHRFL